MLRIVSVAVLILSAGAVPASSASDAQTCTAVEADPELRRLACSRLLADPAAGVEERAQAHNGHGKALRALGEPRAAIEAFNQAIRLRRDDAEAYLHRGHAFMDLDWFGGAIVEYGHAVERDPGNPDAWFHRGLARMAERHPNLELAFADFDQTVRLDPGSARAVYRRGVVQAGLDRPSRAIEDFDAAILIDPGFADAYDRRGTVRLDLGQHRQALADFGKAALLAPGDPGPHENRARAFAVLGDDRRAADAWRKMADAGGARRVLGLQDRLAERRLWTGPFDGVYSSKLEQTLIACTRAGDC